MEIPAICSNDIHLPIQKASRLRSAVEIKTSDQLHPFLGILDRDRCVILAWPVYHDQKRFSRFVISISKYLWGSLLKPTENLLYNQIAYNM